MWGAVLTSEYEKHHPYEGKTLRVVFFCGGRLRGATCTPLTGLMFDARNDAGKWG
jgi:hypothetical protein